jgi:hypothetical protein
VQRRRGPVARASRRADARLEGMQATRRRYGPAERRKELGPGLNEG